ncbi:MAG: hypothetical protein BWK78_02700 [Thiotrichaceae bacterium IS1]|nr:MAG: hypothetical protein BWK78_02700 [Thiotrichaceae bacterium IS1]
MKKDSGGQPPSNPTGAGQPPSNPTGAGQPPSNPTGATQQTPPNGGEYDEYYSQKPLKLTIYPTYFKGTSAVPEKFGKDTVLYQQERYKIQFTVPNEECHIYVYRVYEVNNKKNLEDLVKESGYRNDQFALGKTYILPDINKSFPTDTMVGTGKIYFLATRKPIPSNPNDDDRIKFLEELKPMEDNRINVEFLFGGRDANVYVITYEMKPGKRGEQ